MQGSINRSSSFNRSPQKSMSGNIFVERPEVLEEIISSVEKHTSKTRFVRPTKSNAPISDNGHTGDHAKLLKEQQLQRTLQTESIMKQNIQNALERKVEKQEQNFPVLLSNLDHATKFLDIIEKDIELHDETQKNKVRRQFEDWNSTVHGTIQKKIASSINNMDSKALNRKKNEDYAKFLNITNRKPAIFRDIIIETEYDPLEPNKRCIKAKTGYLKDPVKIDAQKAAAEGAMLGPGVFDSTKHKNLCKDTLDVQLWASGQIEATPYGTFARMMNNTGGGNSSTSNTTRSHVVFDHFDYPRNKAAIDKEMPRGKRIKPILIYADPKKVFNDQVPRRFEQELADIKPPEGHSYLS